MSILDPVVDSILGDKVQGVIPFAVSFQMLASTTEPTSDVTLTIPHSELSSGKTVSLLADGSDTGQDFVDSTTNDRYSLTYTPSASIGSTVDLKAEVDGSGAQSNVVQIVVEEKPDKITDLSGTAGDQQVDLTFTVPDTVENDVTELQVHLQGSSFASDKPQPGDSTLEQKVTSFTEGNQKTVTITGLTNGQTEYIQVLTLDSDGFFNDSNEISLTPSAPVTTTINSAPTQVPARA